MRHTLVVLVAALMLAACASPPEPPRRHYILLFDETSSMNPVDLETAKRLLSDGVISILREGDRIAVLTITESSYTVSEPVVVSRLVVSGRYLDPATDSVNAAIRDAIRQRVASIRISPKHHKTDIYGALARIGILFTEDTLSSKILIIVSDLEDNVARGGIMDQVSFRGVRVYSLFASHTFSGIKDDFLAFRAKKQYWQDLFHKAGATNTFVCDRDTSPLKMDWLVEQIQGE